LKRILETGIRGLDMEWTEDGHVKDYVGNKADYEDCNVQFQRESSQYTFQINVPPLASKE
jgi:hypothetical protein